MVWPYEVNAGIILNMNKDMLSKKVIEAAEASIFIRLSKLKKRNIHVGDKKTSVTLEPLVWELLHDIADDQSFSVHELCTFINDRKNKEASLASAMRVFVMAYMKIQIKANEE